MIKTKSKIIILFVALAVLVIATLIITNFLNDKKKEIEQYDSYANVIEDYSFVLGCNNIVKCQVSELGNYSREYVYNTYYDGDDKVIFQYDLLHNNYKYEKQELFKGINLVKPFPEAALPNFAETHTEFRHYLSEYESEVIFDLDNPHDQISVSFNKAVNFNELMEYDAELDKLGYAVKFCWVDTYSPDEVTNSSAFALGRPVTEQYSGYEKYSKYKTAYGFLLYDNSYSNRDMFDDPAQYFVDIISVQYDDNFMSKELNGIRNSLTHKNTLSVDSLEIIGAVLERKDGKQFSIDEAEMIYDNNELVTFIYS